MTHGARRTVTAVVLSAAAAITLGPEAASSLEATDAAAVDVAGLLPGVSSRPRRSEVEGALDIVVPAALVILLAWSFPGVSRRRIALLTAAAWWTVEAVQLAVPGRHARVRDMALNTTGVAVGLGVLALHGRRRRSRRRGVADAPAAS